MKQNPVDNITPAELLPQELTIHSIGPTRNLNDSTECSGIPYQRCDADHTLVPHDADFDAISG
jgi:hypothetical protein